MLTYIIIGVLFTFFLETINHVNKLGFEFSMLERIITILVWPITLFIFIKNLF
jgi:hypothetical protein